MGLPVVITKALAAASANNIATSQSLAGAGDFTLDGSTVSGGIATLDTQRRVIITSGGNDSGITFTIWGTNSNGSNIRDTIAGTTGVTQSKLDFKTVTRIAASGATASTVTAGTNGVGSTHWLRYDPHLTPPNMSLSGELLSGSANWGVQYCYDEFLVTPGQTQIPAYMPDTPAPTAWPHADLQAQTGTKDGNITVPCVGVRFIINSGTGTMRFTAQQSGVAQ